MPEKYTLDYFFDGGPSKLTRVPNLARIKTTLLNEDLSIPEFLSLIPEIQRLHKLEGLERLTRKYFDGLEKHGVGYQNSPLSVTYVAIASEELYPRLEKAIEEHVRQVKEYPLYHFNSETSKIIGKGTFGEMKELRWKDLDMHLGIKLIIYNPQFPHYRDNQEPLEPPEQLPSLD